MHELYNTLVYDIIYPSIFEILEDLFIQVIVMLYIYRLVIDL